MIEGIRKKLCENNALLAEKVEQSCELVEQTELLCEKLDAVLDPDAECPPCPVLRHTFIFEAFDTDSGVFDDEFVHTTTVNGTAVSTPYDPATMTNKSEVYVDTVAAVNATGATMSVVTDVAVADTGRVVYQIVIPVGQSLDIVNTHTGAVFSFSSDGETCVGTFQDSEGVDIESGAPVEQ